MLIYHVATAADWEHARRSGSYTTSTLGRSLEDEGFLHAAHGHQVAGVLERYYAGVPEPLVLLTVDTELLDVPWREDRVAEEDFPHVYGPLAVDAVVAVDPLGGTGPGSGPAATGR
jgi:uncharacterized protein (DUF952 family)